MSIFEREDLFVFETAGWMAIEEDEFERCFSPLNDFVVEEVGDDGAAVGGLERL